MSLEDGGLYMCQINTDPMTSQSAWLSVQIPPDIDMARTSGDITAREHEVRSWSVMMMIMVMMMSGHGEAHLSRGGGAHTQDSLAERGRGQDTAAQQSPSAQVTSGDRGSFVIRDIPSRQVDIWTGDTLEIHRVRREDMGAYLCIASNDVPPTVSKRIYLHVQCE